MSRKSNKNKKAVEFEFKNKFPLEKRIEQSTKILQQFPNFIPMIVEPGDAKTVRKMEKTKFLVPDDYQVLQFMQMLRTKVTLLKDQAIYIFLENNSIPSANSTISSLYEKNANKDGFLYLHYCTENTFGFQL